MFLVRFDLFRYFTLKCLSTWGPVDVLITHLCCWCRCVEGYYGNPVSRQPCQSCLCPDVQSSGRFFATSCQQDPQSLSVTCNCREGHTGELTHVSAECQFDKRGERDSFFCFMFINLPTPSGPRCDRCRPGFYGNLVLPGARCEKCRCNNNIDPDDHHACDSLTGECLHCLYNTMGPRCQACRPAYYGNALDQDCKGKDKKQMKVYIYRTFHTKSNTTHCLSIRLFTASGSNPGSPPSWTCPEKLLTPTPKPSPGTLQRTLIRVLSVTSQ